MVGRRRTLLFRSRAVESIGTVLAQQGSQIADVFTSSRGTVGGFFKQVTGWLSSFLTLGRVAFGGVTAAVLARYCAQFYLDAQRNVQLALSGIGRASGATASTINAAASAGASPFGLSVSGARDLATALASDWKVANDWPAADRSARKRLRGNVQRIERKRGNRKTSSSVR